MKKIFSILIIVVLVLFVGRGCSGLSSYDAKDRIDWCEYNDANRFIEKFNKNNPNDKITNEMITENYWLGAEIKYNDFVSFHVGEDDGSPYYQCKSNKDYSPQNRKQFIAYANKMIKASTYDDNEIATIQGDYPQSKKEVKGTSVAICYEESDEEPIFMAEVRPALPILDY